MAQAAPVIAVVFETCAAHIGCEQSHAFCRLRSSEPYKCQPTGVKRAILRSNANAVHLPGFQAKKHDELARAFQFHGSLCLRPRLDGRAAIFVMLAFQAAGATVTIAAAIVVATGVVIAGCLIDAVTDPFRLVRSRCDRAKRSLQAS